MEYKRIDQKAILGWRIGRGITFVVLLLCMLVSRIVLGVFEATEDIILYVTVAWGILLIYKAIGFFVYPKIEYLQWGYQITEEKVQIRHGIFFRETTVVPVVRIQHIAVEQGPINRKLGIYKVTMALASGKFEIVGLPEKEAMEISEYLKEKLYHRLEVREANGQ